MTPRKQPKKIPASKGAGKRAATIEPRAAMSNPPRTPVGPASRRQTRSATALPDSRTSREATQDTLTPPAPAALKDIHVPQNVAEVIVMRPENVQTTIEGQSPSQFDDISTSKSVDRTLSSGITKSASRGTKSNSRSRSRVSAADTPNNATPAKTKLAAMLEQLREGEREAANAIEQASTAIKEAKTAGKEARAAVRQVKELALEARQEALAMTERALEEKQEAMDTKKQALEIGEKYRPVS